MVVATTGSQSQQWAVSKEKLMTVQICLSRSGIRKKLQHGLCTPEKSITLQFMNVHHQVGSNDCGLYSLAYATALCNGIDPTACIFDQEEM